MRRDAKPFDATTKFLLEIDPAGWLECAGLGRPGAATVIDADLATVTSEADKVIRVEEPRPWLGHLEFQGNRDGHLPDRLLQYNVLLRSRHGVPVQSVVILLRREADHPELTGIHRHHHVFGDCYLVFHYHVVRVWELPVEEVLKGPLATLPLAPVTQVPQEELPSVIRRLDARFQAEASPSDAALLWTATYILMGLRFPAEVSKQLLQGVRAMKESSTYQAILEEVREVGRVEGREEGRAEEAQALILRLGRKRLGDASAEAEAVLRSILDRPRLERIAERVLEVESWSDLLATD